MQILWVYLFLGLAIYPAQILLKSGQAPLFSTDINKGTFTNVAGVPPDYFNADGSFGVTLFTNGMFIERMISCGGEID